MLDIALGKRYSKEKYKNRHLALNSRGLCGVNVSFVRVCVVRVLMKAKTIFYGRAEQPLWTPASQKLNTEPPCCPTTPVIFLLNTRITFRHLV